MRSRGVGSMVHRARRRGTEVIVIVLAVAVCATEPQTQRDVTQNENVLLHDGSCKGSSGATTIALPAPPDRATQLATELLHPFSLRTFADEFWERKPLLVRGRSPHHGQRLLSFGIDDVDTVIENGVSLSGDEPFLVSGSDWNIIKRVFNPKDDEFWTAAFSPPRPGRPSPAAPTSTAKASGDRRDPITLDEVHGAFQRGGFSVVINRLQRRWRSMADIALALEYVLGQPVNANMYMTPPGQQAFEAHFDWMDGIIVQLVGSKKWILYDELLPAPRADMKYKPRATQLGEPIAVVEMNPGDLMYIPRGFPHEAATNATADAGRAQGVSLHVTFGIESVVWGSYESLMHHAIEEAAAAHPDLFFEGAEKKHEENCSRSSDDTLPWLQLLHLCVHDVASRDERLRKAVPLAPLFAEPPSTTTLDTPSSKTDSETVIGSPRCVADPTEEGTNDTTSSNTECLAKPPGEIEAEFKRSIRALEAGVDATGTLQALDSLLEAGQLEQVPFMYSLGGETAASREARDERDKKAGLEDSRRREMDGTTWNRETFQGLSRTRFSAELRRKLEGLLEVADATGALSRMVLSVETVRLDRAAATERDLTRCGQ